MALMCHIGLIHVQGLEEAWVLHIIDERNKNGNYHLLQDFIERIKPGLFTNPAHVLIRYAHQRHE